MGCLEFPFAFFMAAAAHQVAPKEPVQAGARMCIHHLFFTRQQRLKKRFGFVEPIQHGYESRDIELGRESRIDSELPHRLAEFTRERLEASYADAGLELVEWWTDPDDLYALSLARPVD